MTTNIFQDIKDRVNLRDLVRYYGLEVNRGVRLICFAKRQPAARFTTSTTLALKSMKIITTASGDHVDFYLDKLLFGSKEEKYALYDSDRDYPLSIKNRLDSLDAVSRKA